MSPQLPDSVTDGAASLIDAALTMQAAQVAAVLAAGLLLLAGWPWRQPRPARLALGGALGVAVGFFAGAWWLGLAPNVPPREDQDRLLLLLLPALVAVELAAAYLQRSAWLLRLAIAVAAARLVLHGSVYLADVSSAGASTWPAGYHWPIVCGLAALLLGAWLLLHWLAQRQSSRGTLLTLALTTAAAALTIMLSGYASGGLLGLPLAAALAGTALASWLLAGTLDLSAPLGVGLVSLYALLLSGHFFGSLTTTHALLLFAAPLVGVLLELPLIRRLGPRWRGVVAVLLAVVLLGIVLDQAWEEFKRSAQPPTTSSPTVPEPTIDDYMNFGK